MGNCMKMILIFVLFIQSMISVGQRPSLTGSIGAIANQHYFGRDFNESCGGLIRLEDNLISNGIGLKYPSFISFLPKIKYEFGSIRSINIGVSTIDWEGDDIVAIPAWYNGPFLESGIAFSQPNNLLCNKIGYEYFWLLMGGRLNLVHYTDFHDNQFLFRPEVGLSLFSFLTVTYGYNFKLPGNSNLIKPGNIYSINLALPIYKKEYRDME